MTESLESTPEPATPAPASPAPASPAPAIALVSTRRLLAESFDLLSRSGRDLRRASFYIGAITLGTVGPLALGSWAITLFSVERSTTEMESVVQGPGALSFAIMVAVATIGLVVAAVESRTLAVTVLAGAMVERPISTRRALARSRRSFWRAVAASIIVAIPLSLAEAVVTAILGPVLGVAVEASVVTSTAVTALVGAPFAYTLAGVVLGDVDPFEALKRSFRVYGARKRAAMVVVVFETVAALLILFGISAGLDVALRIFESLGLGPDAGPVALAVTTAGIVSIVFAFGTLLFTVMALTVAPQVVMFVGLTHATFGLDRVRPGGPDDPVRPRQPGTGGFRWFPRPMLVGFLIGALGLAGLVSAYP